uniref:Uncharacterized protein n=1 Tax=Anguilla anguilla TaxID=7936 RepID=A0A0E9X5D6_ANGAN
MKKKTYQSLSSVNFECRICEGLRLFLTVRNVLTDYVLSKDNMGVARKHGCCKKNNQTFFLLV